MNQNEAIGVEGRSSTQAEGDPWSAGTWPVGNGSGGNWPAGNWPATPARGIDAFSSRAVWAMIGGLLVTIAAFLPFINQSIDGDSFDGEYGYVKPGALHTSCVFGIVLLLLAVATYWARSRKAFTVATIVAGAMGAAGYLIFMIVGFAGVQDDELFGARVTWSPNIGLLASIVGSVITLTTGIAMLRSSVEH